MRFTPLLPLLLTMGAFILGVLCLFAGNKPGFMEGYDIITVSSTLSLSHHPPLHKYRETNVAPSSTPPPSATPPTTRSQLPPPPPRPQTQPRLEVSETGCLTRLIILRTSSPTNSTTSETISKTALPIASPKHSGSKNGIPCIFWICVWVIMRPMRRRRGRVRIPRSVRRRRQCVCFFSFYPIQI